MTRFPKDIPSDILSRADELLSAKYGTDRPIDPEIVELVCRGMMEERTRASAISRARASLYLSTEAKNACAEIASSIDAKAIRGTE